MQHTATKQAATVKLKEKLQALVGADSVKEDEPLARHCNWRVGGPADRLVTVRTADQLARAVLLAREHGLPVTVLGFGANVLVSDRGIRGLVILNRAQRIAFLSDFIVEADSGTNLAVLAKETARRGLGDLEFLVGIPGTVGAAVAVNAGTRTEWVSSILVEALLLRHDGSKAWVEAKTLGFSYRNSLLKESGEIVLGARFRGRPLAPNLLEHNLANQLKVRKRQPSGPSAGSVFTNPQGDFAGRLIEACGLKGYTCGAAQVSKMHANFIINTGGASAKDIRTVIEHVKGEVAATFGIRLREEIRYLGEW